MAIGLLVAALLIVGYSTFQISLLRSDKETISGSAVQINPDNTQNTGTKDIANTAIDVTPKGIPNIYGKELGLSFDDVSSLNPQKADATIKKLGMLDQQITLGGKGLERYIAVVSQISCEYCCGVESIIFSDGKAACGCAHSFAMRGLAKYLIKNHGDEYTNDGILEELGKWKTLFFPVQIGKKAAILQEKGIELNYINLASNKYRGIETGGNAIQVEKIDTSGWTEDEKMMYEHHGVLPTRLQKQQ